MRRIAVIFLSFSLMSTLVAQTERRPMTVDDALDMVGVGDVLMSPDGQWVFFSKSELNWKENKRDETYFMVSAGGGEPFQFIGEGGGSSFQFSPDGKYLSLQRTVDKKSQIFLMRTAGGEAVQLTEHENGVGSYKWSPTGDSIFFVAARKKSKEEEQAIKDGADHIVVDEGPNGQRQADWQDLWRVDIESKVENKLTSKDFRIGGFDVSPDGRQVVFTARYENRRNQGNLSEIHLLNVETGDISVLTNNKAPENRPLWAPNGTEFAFSAPDDRQWELRNDKIWVMDPETGEYRMVSGSFEGSIRGIKWTPDSRSILFSGLQRTNTNLYRLNVGTGEIEQLTDREGTLQAQDFDREGSRFVYSFSDFDTPADLYTSSVDDFSAVRLTRLNPGVEQDLALASGRVIRWKSQDGMEVEGLLHLPAGYEGGPIPLILNIHGGPAGVFTNGFSARYHIHAGLGYASLSPNVRGSSGYSDQLLRGNMADIGGGDYRDLMTGVDYVIEKGWADPDRLGVRGWSYGGILGGFTITRTDRFKAASIGAGVYDWTSEYGPGFNHDVRLWYIGGTPWDNPEGYRQKSALTHAKNITTPTLLLHGNNDRTDTEPQSMMLFTALKDLGREVRYIRFPREPHGFREPRHQRTRDIEEIRWMQKYVIGVDWTPWERKTEEKKEETTESGRK